MSAAESAVIGASKGLRHTRLAGQVPEPLPGAGIEAPGAFCIQLPDRPRALTARVYDPSEFVTMHESFTMP